MAKKQTVQDTSWEIKDRTYLTSGSNKPLTLKIPSRHSSRHALLYYDERQMNNEKLDTLLIKTRLLKMSKKEKLL